MNRVRWYHSSGAAGTLVFAAALDRKASVDSKIWQVLETLLVLGLLFDHIS